MIATEQIQVDTELNAIILHTPSTHLRSEILNAGLIMSSVVKKLKRDWEQKELIIHEVNFDNAFSYDQGIHFTIGFFDSDTMNLIAEQDFLCPSDRSMWYAWVKKNYPDNFDDTDYLLEPDSRISYEMEEGMMSEYILDSAQYWKVVTP